MKNLTELISKKVIAIDEGECFGYILDVCIENDSKKVIGFLICDEESETLNFLDLKNVVSIDDFVVIRNINSLEYGEAIETNNPIGKVVISIQGINLGYVLDAFLEDKKVTKIITNLCEISTKNIIDFGAKFLIFSEKKLKKNIKKNNIFEKELKENIVKIQEVKVEERKNKNSYQIPFKSTISFGDLIGKMAINDVFGMNNEIIIRKNDIVTEKTIKKAKKHNKTSILYFNIR